MLPALPRQPGARSSGPSSSSGFSRAFHWTPAPGGQSLVSGRAPRSLRQHGSEGLIFLPIRIDSRGEHGTFAKAVGYMGRKPVKTVFIE